MRATVSLRMHLHICDCLRMCGSVTNFCVYVNFLTIFLETLHRSWIKIGLKHDSLQYYTLSCSDTNVSCIPVWWPPLPVGAWTRRPGGHRPGLWPRRLNNLLGCDGRCSAGGTHQMCEWLYITELFQHFSRFWVRKTLFIVGNYYWNFLIQLFSTPN